jgi:uncharacterized protein (DUF305 family)
MAFRFRFSFVSAAFLSLTSFTAWGQAGKIVQPGAPGHDGKTLTPATAAVTLPETPESDTKFMQGMIMHHSQAVEMTALLRTRSHNKAVQALGDRISISQTDEIKFMKQWLADRGKAVPTEHDQMQHMAGMAGMDHSKMDHSKMDHSSMNMGSMDMGSMPMMPGMLTPQQMEALAKADGPAFDHLFLTGMIQHHTGALIMVDELFDTPGAGQDNLLFDFATDVDNTQRAEIRIMQGMLDKEKK